MFDLIEAIRTNWDQYAQIATCVIAAAAAIAAVTPTPADDSALLWMRRILDVIGLNIGHAKNRQ